MTARERSKQSGRSPTTKERINLLDRNGSGNRSLVVFP
jgi:hypothetical protein